MGWKGRVEGCGVGWVGEFAEAWDQVGQLEEVGGQGWAGRWARYVLWGGGGAGGGQALLCFINGAWFEDMGAGTFFWRVVARELEELCAPACAQHHIEVLAVALHIVGEVVWR